MIIIELSEDNWERGDVYVDKREINSYGRRREIVIKFIGIVGYNGIRYIYIYIYHVFGYIIGRKSRSSNT